MGSRLQCSIEAINKMSLEELASIGNARTQEAVLKRLSPSRREALIQECEDRVTFYQNKICNPGFEATSPRSFQGNGFSDPYTELKRYSHIYTCLAGWMTAEDMTVREHGIGALFSKAE